MGTGHEGGARSVYADNRCKRRSFHSLTLPLDYIVLGPGTYLLFIFFVLKQYAEFWSLQNMLLVSAVLLG